MRLWLGLVVAAVAVVAAASALGAPPDSARATAVATRALTDRPDEISGPQVHFLYVVPADGADAQLDTSGAMEQSIIRIERWFVKQTGNQGLRVDTYDGAPDITFVRMPHTAAQATAVNPWPIWVLGEDLVSAGFNDPGKIYAAFYDGPSTFACGGATSPALPKLGAMYLQAWPTGGAVPCSAAPGIGTGLDTPGFFEIGLLHEILHTIDFVPDCAPHVSADGYSSHVNDSPLDIMYGPDASSPGLGDWRRSTLDVNRDDYYRAGIPGCNDLSTSPYLAPLQPVSVSVTGAGTVTSKPIGVDCPTSCSWSFPGAVTLTAAPLPGATFNGWSGACTGTATCVIPAGGSASASFTVPHSVSVSVSGPGIVTSSPAGIDCPGICSDTFLGSVTLTAAPFGGVVFKGWGGACSGTGPCVLTGEGAVTASFAAARHGRSLTLRVRARRATGTLRVADGYLQCRARAPVVVERRGKKGWSIVRRTRTNKAGAYAVSLPKGRATYRARAPETSPDGEICVKAASRAVGTRG